MSTRTIWLAIAFLIVTSGGCRTQSSGDAAATPDRRSTVLAWNAIVVETSAADHALDRPDQPGPTHTARAFALVQLAMYDAANSVERRFLPHHTFLPSPSANVDAAVTEAAYAMLMKLYPRQASRLGRHYETLLGRVPEGLAKEHGIALGRHVAARLQAVRTGELTRKGN